MKLVDIRSLALVIAIYCPAAGAWAALAAEVIPYPRRTEFEAGQTLLPLVVEVLNLAEKVVVITGRTEVERRVAPGPAAVAPLREVRLEPARTGQLRLRVIIYVPPGSPQRQLAQVGGGTREANAYEVKPGGSLLSKVELPPEAFESGTCKFEVMLMDGPDIVSRSEAVSVRCTERAK
jgi:hypothetical protein